MYIQLLHILIIIQFHTEFIFTKQIAEIIKSYEMLSFITLGYNKLP